MKNLLFVRLVVLFKTFGKTKRPAAVETEVAYFSVKEVFADLQTKKRVNHFEKETINERYF
ncbi:hypothetical protein [Novipirellula rosea]|uniref:hypothetical protein n=1 Tax=Novipirellula rosea TaxID=1031540 RepID=UPI0031EB07BB